MQTFIVALLFSCLIIVKGTRLPNCALARAFTATTATKDHSVLTLRGGSTVHHIEDVQQFDDLLSRAEGLVIVDFSAEWCGPCKMIAPVFDELARGTPGAVFIKIDVDKTPELADRFEVQGMPTFIFIKNGDVKDRFAGASPTKLKETLDALL